MANYLLDAVKGYGLVHDIANQRDELKDRQADRALKREIIEEERGERTRLKSEKEEGRKIDEMIVNNLLGSMNPEETQAITSNPIAMGKIQNIIQNPEEAAQALADSDKMVAAIENGYYPANENIARFFNFSERPSLDARTSEAGDGIQRRIWDRTPIMQSPNDPEKFIFNFETTRPDGTKKIAPPTTGKSANPSDNIVQEHALDDLINIVGGTRETIKAIMSAEAKIGRRTMLDAYLNIVKEHKTEEKEIKKETQKEESELRKRGWGISQEKKEELEAEHENKLAEIRETAKYREPHQNYAGTTTILDDDGKPVTVTYDKQGNILGVVGKYGKGGEKNAASTRAAVNATAKIIKDKKGKPLDQSEIDDLNDMRREAGLPEVEPFKNKDGWFGSDVGAKYSLRRVTDKADILNERLSEKDDAVNESRERYKPTGKEPRISTIEEAARLSAGTVFFNTTNNRYEKARGKQQSFTTMAAH